MNFYCTGLAMLALAPSAAQAQTVSTATSAPAAQQQPGAAPGPQAGGASTGAQARPQGQSGQGSASGSASGARGDGHGGRGGHPGQGLRPQPTIIVDANALIREGQRANAMEEAQSAPPPRLSTPAKKKPGVHLSTSRPLPLSTEDAGKP